MGGVSEAGQTGQKDETIPRTRGPGGWSAWSAPDQPRCSGPPQYLLPQGFSDQVQAGRGRGVAEGSLAGPISDGGTYGRSELAFGLASAAATAPMVSLDRCIGDFQQVKADGAGLLSLGRSP